MPRARAGRVIVVIAGEASAELALQWASSGDLPNLRQMLEQGVGGSLQAAEPLITAQLFGSLLTSCDPGEHGLFDFWQRGPDGAFRETLGRDIKAPPVWRLASNEGLRCGVVNLPFTFPPEPLNGFVLAGSDAPGAHRSIAYPPKIYDDLVARFGAYPLKDIYPGGRDKSDYLTLVNQDADRWAEIIGYLAATQNWDLLLCYSAATAMTQHYFWGDMTDDRENNPYRNVIRSAFVGLDRLIGRLRKQVGHDADMFVVSECGAGPLVRGVDVNAFLAQEGLLTFAQIKHGISGSSARGLFGKARYLAQRHLPTAIRASIQRQLAPAKAWLQNSFDRSGIDWAHTRAFSRGEEGQIFINLAGRDPHGIVQPGTEYEALCDRVAEGLLSLRDPVSGVSAVTAVYKSSDYYIGPWCDRAPDLVVQWRNGEYMPNEDEKRGREIFGERWREGMSWPTTGSHRPSSTFFAAGPSIVAGNCPLDGKTIDLVPTWLHCLGVEPPTDLRGRVLGEILRSPSAGADVAGAAS